MNVRSFTTVSELLADLHAEEAPRFVVRFILVSGLQAWRDVIAALRGECALVRLSAFCQGDDLLPNLGDLCERLENTEGERLLVLPLGELLRLGQPQIVLLLRELATWAPDRAKRVYIPVLEAAGTMSQELGRVGRYASGECEVWSLVGEGEVDVHAVPFSIPCPQRQEVKGVRAYLELWEQGGAAQVLLVSQWAQHWLARYDRFRFRVGGDAYTVVADCVPGADKLQSAWGCEEEWRWLAGQTRGDEPFERLAGRLLNVLQFEPHALFGAWRTLTEKQRWLVWLWARSLPSSGSFIDGVVHEASSYAELGESAYRAALQRELTMEQLTERRELLSSLGAEGMSLSLWAQFRAQEDPLLRLKALAGLSSQEQEQIVLNVARLLDAGVPEGDWLPVLRVTFPELASYLMPFPYANVGLREYLYAYTRSKLANEPLGRLLERGKEWAETREVWSYPTRAKLLAEVAPQRVRTVWVDALGVEWAGLLHDLLNDKETECTVQVGRAELPTSTHFNKGWEKEDEVERELDRLAHDVEYAYPRSLVRQLRWLGDLAKRVRFECLTAPEVVLTGDHGLTRFAAHGEKVKPPEGYEVHQWGRYAWPTGGASPGGEEGDDWVRYNNCLILAKHALFQGGAHTQGEVHGGGTLEEALVPVLRVRRRAQGVPVARLVEEQVRLDTRGAGELVIEVSEPVQELRLALAGKTFDGRREPGNRWIVPLRDFRGGAYTGTLHYEKGRLGEVHFTASRGMAEEDLGLPG